MHILALKLGLWVYFGFNALRKALETDVPTFFAIIGETGISLCKSSHLRNYAHLIEN